MITIELYQTRNHRKLGGRPQTWRWRATAPNNKTLAQSSEAYTNKADALTAITTLFDGTTDIVLRTPQAPEQPLRSAP